MTSGVQAKAPLGALLKSHRERAGLTQRDLAVRSGVSLAAVRDIEQGRSLRPRRDSTRALAAALGLAGADETRFLAAALAVPEAATSLGAPRVASKPAPHRTATTLGVLGPLTVWRGGVALPLTADKPRSLLLRLALSAGDVVGREELMDLIWGRRRPASATNLLYTYIGRLRRLLQPEPSSADMLSSGKGGYRLTAGPDQLDLAWFRELAARGAVENDPEKALGHYAAAARLWRGDTDVDALRNGPLMTAVTEEYATLLRDYAAAARELGESEQVLPRLRELADRLEMHEPLHAELVVTLSAAGRQTEALAAYERVRATLGEQLGIDPGRQLRDAHQGVLQQRWRSTPRGSPRRDAIRQAPAAPPDFVGRDRELAVILEALGRPADESAPSTRVIAVNGPAGVGKTALALHVAQRLRDDLPEGQLYADLRGVSREPVAPLDVLGRFLRALGVPAQRVGTDEIEAAALLRSELADRRMLMILDNARDAQQLAPLLPGTGACAVLVTSRRRLADLPGATAVDLRTLPFADALDLLAAAAGPQRILAEPQSARQLTEACGQLPLALRIAGARLAGRPAWTAADLVNRLRDTGRRLTELSVGELDVLASFQLSYQDLSDAARRAFRLCALHPGDDFGLAEAAALLGTEPDRADPILGELLDANMLLQYSADRYRYHDLLGLYATRLLTDADAREHEQACDRLYAWYLRAATAALEWVYPQLVRLASCTDREAVFASSDAALAWLDAEAPALVSLVERVADSGHRQQAWLIADQLRGYFFIRRHVDRWLRSADAGLRAATAVGDPSARAAMLTSRGQAMWAMGRHGEALEAYAEGVRAAEAGGWRPAAAYLRHNIGLALAEQGRLEEAEASYRLALELSEDDEFGHVRAVTLNGLGVMCTDQGRLTAAAEYFAAALRINEATGRETSIPANLVNLGMVLRQIGQESAAETHLHAALDGYRRLVNPAGELSTLDELSQLHSQRGQDVEAVSAARQGYDLAQIGQNRRTQAALLCTLGEAHLGGGDVPAALDAFGQALELGAEYPFFATRATVGLAGARLRDGDADEAVGHAESALKAARAHGFRMLEAGALEVRARCAAGGDPASAARFAADAAEAYRAAGAALLAERVEAEHSQRRR